MVLKIVYTTCVLIICLMIYFKIRKKENSIAFIVITGIITTIVGNILIPSGISIFEISDQENTTHKNTIISQQSKNDSFSDEMYSNIKQISDLGCSELKKTTNTEYVANKLLELCVDQPESLAAIVSVFPNALKSVGITETDPLKLEKLLESEGAGELQKKLIGMLKVLLDHPSTEYAYGKFNGSALTLDMHTKDESMDSTVDNVYLAWAAIELDDAPALILTTHVKGYEPETGIFDLRTSFQPIVEFHASSADNN